jgi:hypothetical protein
LLRDLRADRSDHWIGAGTRLGAEIVSPVGATGAAILSGSLLCGGTQVPAVGPDWIHEIKHDGYRLIVQREGKRTDRFGSKIVCRRLKLAVFDTCLPRAGHDFAPFRCKQRPASHLIPGLAMPAATVRASTILGALQDYFADGMVDDIITALSHFKSLFVIARNSSFTYKGRAVDVKQVGRELGVRYVLEGSVRKSANRVRITGQLVDTATGALRCPVKTGGFTPVRLDVGNWKSLELICGRTVHRWFSPNDKADLVAMLAGNPDGVVGVEPFPKGASS